MSYTIQSPQHDAIAQTSVENAADVIAAHWAPRLRNAIEARLRKIAGNRKSIGPRDAEIAYDIVAAALDDLLDHVHGTPADPGADDRDEIALAGAPTYVGQP